MSNDHPSFGQTPSGSQPPSIGELFGRMTGQISSLTVAGVLALYGLGWLFHSIELALVLVLPAWAASLIVCGGIFFFVLILALAGISQLKKSRAHVPHPQDGLKESMDALKKGAHKDEQ